MKPLWTYLGLFVALCLCGGAARFAPPPVAAAAHHCACPACPGAATCCCTPATTPEAATEMRANCGPAAPILATVQTAAALPASPVAAVAASPGHRATLSEPLALPPGRATPPPAQPPWTA